MKKKILKNLKELIIMLIMFVVVTFIMSLVFKRNGFTNTFWVFLITAVITKVIVTIYDCSKKENN